MGKGITFFLFMMICISIAGNVMQGSVGWSSTHLTVAVAATGDVNTITVVSTEGFPDTGIIQINDERFHYTAITATTFTETDGQDLERAQDDTIEAYHAAGASVRTVEGSMLNTAITHNVAVIADASGLWAIPTILLALMRIFGSILLSPFTWLGTDLMILGVLWSAMAAGMLISVALSLAGGRRV